MSYIEREKIWPALNAACVPYNRATAKAIEDIPAADVRPVVRGKWIVSKTDYSWHGVEFPAYCKCSECGREVPYQDRNNFCHHCGADMREES